MPFFSISVPTYNRKELLKQTLKSILDQSFTDYEILVGNDFIQEKLSGELLGIYDSRIHFINNMQNIGEAGNMNLLLEKAQGKYFTWLSDDDIYAPNFLEEVHSAILNNNMLKCFYTSHGWIYGTIYPRMRKRYRGRLFNYSGKEFVKQLFGGKIKTAGCYGVFELNTIKQIGGITPLSDTPISIHSEFLLLVQTSLLDNVVYIDAPLFFSRDYKGTFSGSTIEFELYRRAGKNLLHETLKVICVPNLIDEFQIILVGVTKIIIKYFIMRFVGREKNIHHDQIETFIKELRVLLDTLRGNVQYDLALESWNTLINKRWTVTIMLAKMKWNSPPIINNCIKKFRSIISRL